MHKGRGSHNEKMMRSVPDRERAGGEREEQGGLQVEREIRWREIKRGTRETDTKKY